MLTFIGLGLEQSPTLYELKVLRECEEIFYEGYTSPTMRSDTPTLIGQSLLFSGNEEKKESGPKIQVVKREFVEDGRRILDLAKESNVALVCSGDPFVATTHQELRARAINSGIRTKVIHGSSILSAVGGELGLSSYSFGKTVTMTRSPMQYSAYLTIYQNLLRGLHTVLLLEWDESSRFFLSPKDAAESLFSAEKDLKYGVITEDTMLLAASRIGSMEQNSPIITCLSLGEARIREDLGSPPITLVIPGRLHFTEIEALSAITHSAQESLRDNSRNIEHIADLMVKKYSQKTLAALSRARRAVKSSKEEGMERKYDSVFENVELYTSDALRFLNEGKEELAVLSIGYAEGLLDSLRFSQELEFEW